MKPLAVGVRGSAWPRPLHSFFGRASSPWYGWGGSLFLDLAQPEPEQPEPELPALVGQQRQGQQRPGALPELLLRALVLGALLPELLLPGQPVVWPLEGPELLRP